MSKIFVKLKGELDSFILTNIFDILQGFEIVEVSRFLTLLFLTYKFRKSSFGYVYNQLLQFRFSLLLSSNGSRMLKMLDYLSVSGFENRDKNSNTLFMIDKCGNAIFIKISLFFSQIQVHLKNKIFGYEKGANLHKFDPK